MNYHLPEIIAALRRGGFYDRLMAAGPELARVKRYFQAWAGDIPAPPRDPLQHPHYPLFPGLRHKPFHDPRDFPAAAMLERHFEAIRAEAVALDDQAELDYPMAWTLEDRQAGPRAWTVYLFQHMGVEVEPVTGRCPETRAILRTLPGLCGDYVWADNIFSAMAPGTHLRPHCSVDNFRVRIHLGLVVPPGCEIRVGPERRSWAEGRCLVFEDSFEHEVWNRSGERRIVLIVDVWHPDLTPVEVRALTAAFRKSEVRELFVHERIGLTTSPTKHLEHIRAALPGQDDSPLIREFWPS